MLSDSYHSPPHILSREGDNICPPSDETGKMQEALTHRGQLGQLASREAGCLDVFPEDSYSKALGFIFSPLQRLSQSTSQQCLSP